MEYAWLNGEVVPADEARVPITDRGFLQGDGCFETVRIHHGAPFRLEGHHHRLEESLRLMGLPPPLPSADIRAGARALVQASPLAEGLLRITVTAYDPEKASGGTTAMTIRALPEVPATVALHVSESCLRLPGPLSRCKTTSRALESAALREARRVGAFDAILLNPSGRLVETTARNLFLVREGSVKTPPLSEGALPGITREAVLALASELGIDVEETPIPREALARAEEVFLTGSGVGVLGVAGVGDRAYASPGPATRRLAEAFADLLDREARW